MKKPSNRKERINFLKQKKGYGYVSALASLTDSELRKHFDLLWENGLKNENNYISTIEPAICLRCNSEVEFISICGCGERMAVIDIEGFNPDDEEDQRIKTEYLKNHPESYS